MIHDRQYRVLTFTAPSLALLIAAVLQGCCSSSTCDCESSTVQENRSGSIPVEKLSDWVTPSGELVPDCVEVCREAVGLLSSNVECQLDSIRDPVDTNGADSSLGGQGGMGGSGEPGGPEAILEVTCTFTETNYCEGRRHACWTSGPQGEGDNRFAAWLARAASAEAASVESFRLLAQDLRRVGAPQALIDRASSAAADEVIHANWMNRLAAAHGGVSRAVPFRPVEQRTLFELALENAEEGCTKETFAALVALHQASHATDPEIASCMKRIAQDELRHGQFAWDLHQWFLSQLASVEAEQLERALLRSLQNLSTIPFREQLTEQDSQRLGLPSKLMLPRLASRLAHVLVRAA